MPNGCLNHCCYDLCVLTRNAKFEHLCIAANCAARCEVGHAGLSACFAAGRRTLKLQERATELGACMLHCACANFMFHTQLNIAGWCKEKRLLQLQQLQRMEGD